MKKLIDQAEDINIVGVVKPKEDANIQMLSSGIYYSSDLVDHIIQYASNSEIVKKQLEQPDKNPSSFLPASLLLLMKQHSQTHLKWILLKLTLIYQSI